jgi:hypothetical protein
MSAKTSIYTKLFYITAFKLKLFLQSTFEYTRINGDKKNIYILGHHIPQDFIDICLERHLKMYTVTNQSNDNVRVLPREYRTKEHLKAYKFIDVLLAFKKVEKEIDDSGKSFLNKKGPIVGITIELDESLKANLRALEKIVRKYYDPRNYGKVVRENSTKTQNPSRRVRQPTKTGEALSRRVRQPTKTGEALSRRVQTPFRVTQPTRRAQTPFRTNKNTRRNTSVMTMWENNLPV